MIGLVTLSADFTDGNEGNPQADEPNWRQRMWNRFVEWLMEPIPFPGKLDINMPPAERYNGEERPHPETTEVIDGRRTS